MGVDTKCKPTEARKSIITYDNAFNEIESISKQLTLKNLHSLLGCARGLLKSQKLTGN